MTHSTCTVAVKSSTITHSLPLVVGSAAGMWEFWEFMQYKSALSMSGSYYCVVSRLLTMHISPGPASAELTKIIPFVYTRCPDQPFHPMYAL